LSALSVMSNSSRHTAIVIAVAFGAVALAGCSSSAESATQTTVAASEQSTVVSATDPATTPADQTAAPGEQTAAPSETAISTAPESAAGNVTEPATVDAPVVISTPVPPPAGAGTGGDVAEVAVSTVAAVPLAATAELGVVSTAITNVSALTTTATGPGEIAGPAVAVQVQIKNNAAAPFNLDSVFVTMNDSGGAPGQPSISDPAIPLTGELAPGGQATGTYVFRVPTTGRNPITILVSNSDSAEVVSFVGDAA